MLTPDAGNHAFKLWHDVSWVGDNLQVMYEKVFKHGRLGQVQAVFRDRLLPGFDGYIAPFHCDIAWEDGDTSCASGGYVDREELQRAMEGPTPRGLVAGDKVPSAFAMWHWTQPGKAWRKLLQAVEEVRSDKYLRLVGMLLRHKVHPDQVINRIRWAFDMLGGEEEVLDCMSYPHRAGQWRRLTELITDLLEDGRTCDFRWWNKVEMEERRRSGVPNRAMDIDTCDTCDITEAFRRLSETEAHPSLAQRLAGVIQAERDRLELVRLQTEEEAQEAEGKISAGSVTEPQPSGPQEEQSVPARKPMKRKKRGGKRVNKNANIGGSCAAVEY